MSVATPTVLSPKRIQQILAFGAKRSARLQVQEEPFPHEEMVLFFDTVLPRINQAYRIQAQANRYTAWTKLICGMMMAITPGLGCWYLMRNSPMNMAMLPLAMSGMAYIPLFLMTSGANTQTNQRTGLNRLLSQHAEVRHTRLLVEALAMKGEKALMRQRLTEFLPGYRFTDSPPLEEEHLRVLLRDMETVHAGVAKNRFALSEGAALSRYLAAVLHFLEGELVRGREVDRSALPLLSRVADKPVSNGGGEWNSVQEAAQDCLVRLQGGAIR